jgi:phage terminase small subunit
MAQRGRRSAESLTIGPLATPIAYADAPYDLTDEQADIWRATLASLPSDWIEVGGHPVLAAYCRTTTQLRRLGQLIRQAETEGEFLFTDHYLALIKAHGAAAQVLKTLSTSLRLTPQTRLRAEAASRKAGGFTPGRKPWEA